MLVRSICCQRRNDRCSLHIRWSVPLFLYFSLTATIRLFSLFSLSHTLLLQYILLVQFVYAYVSSTTTTTARRFSSFLFFMRQELNEGGKRERERRRIAAEKERSKMLLMNNVLSFLSIGQSYYKFLLLTDAHSALDRVP